MEVDCMVSMPLVVLTESSMRLVISDSISSAEAPGFDTVTMIVGKIDFRKQIDAQSEEGENADDHQRDDQHGGEDGAFDAERGQFMHGYCALLARSSRPCHRIGRRRWSVAIMAPGEIPERICTVSSRVAPNWTTATRARPSRMK